MLKRPLIERAAGKFRTLIGSYRSRPRKSAMLSRIRVTCTPEIPKATVTLKNSFSPSGPAAGIETSLLTGSIRE